MINRINELRNQANERAVYYSNIGFINLANEFTQLVNILNEMETIVRERDELKIQIENLKKEKEEKNAGI